MNPLYDETVNDLRNRLNAMGVKNFHVDVVPGASREAVVAELVRSFDAMERGQYTTVYTSTPVRCFIDKWSRRIKWWFKDHLSQK